MEYLYRGLYGIAIIAGAWILGTAVNFIIARIPRFNRIKRAETLITITKSLIKYFLVFIAIYLILKITFRLETRSMIATLGVSGLIIGLGAQSFIKDVLTGFFIVVENQFEIGERVTIKGMTGIVSSMGLRMTRLISEDGDVHVIPNNEITIVTNHSRK